MNERYVKMLERAALCSAFIELNLLILEQNKQMINLADEQSKMNSSLVQTLSQQGAYICFLRHELITMGWLNVENEDTRQ